MNKVKVLGMGPGDADYITPRVRKEIENSQVIIGGKRILDSLELEGKEVYYLKGNLQESLKKIQENAREKTVAVLVSGDTGFYSMLKVLKKYFDSEALEIFPGISSMQYMFSKIGHTWEDACLSSVHGRDVDIVKMVKNYPKVGLLTDLKWSPQSIAKELLRAGIKNRKMYIGENLSYNEEVILSGSLEEIAQRKGYQMSVVVILDEEK
ncbi:precorrin-6Y C5,15-methyltransferase (decarboxylating) [Garciella nitratireducens DSM 15102]|uniref:Precorrin-6Y C5,15-methyltransferase (Decarboxylating) n=1 Tax=Garciella nitratireducens DSM 15102 TaxID=1121911 RepID=A0A1T4KIH1_9FIRM|nr:precorrin-6y C5,15-methyltransferase (decarboxylating) subunit CbiE [Garciella nitratireducens]RBP41558.1 precorrin-6Y C5,15-methyltransferase (decarboxylating) [Garciella nitratireducens]SJZ42191.1 precorrin-6Y C5,15-methyltransferase (decarboxylating) [Garciella nitratireducens DSM 15102]